MEQGGDPLIGASGTGGDQNSFLGKPRRRVTLCWLTFVSLRLRDNFSFFKARQLKDMKHMKKGEKNTGGLVTVRRLRGWKKANVVARRG